MASEVEAHQQKQTEQTDIAEPTPPTNIVKIGAVCQRYNDLAPNLLTLALAGTTWSLKLMRVGL